MTFHELAGGDDALASQVMENFKHNNFGNALLPLDLSGNSVDNAIDLGSQDKKFRKIYGEEFYSNFGRIEFRQEILSGTNVGGYVEATVTGVTRVSDDKTSDSFTIATNSVGFSNISFVSKWNLKINGVTIISNLQANFVELTPLSTVDSTTNLDSLVRTTQPVVVDRGGGATYTPTEFEDGVEKITFARFVKGNSLSQFSEGAIMILKDSDDFKLQLYCQDTDPSDYYYINFTNFDVWGTGL